MNGKNTMTEKIGQILKWSEVSKIHRTRNGIYQRNGLLISLLTDFGRFNPAYPDFHGETRDTIHYTGSGRRGNQKVDQANQALMDAINSGVKVPLYNKLDVNQWEFLGKWSVVGAKYIYDESSERMVWKFELKRVK